MPVGSCYLLTARYTARKLVLLLLADFCILNASQAVRELFLGPSCAIESAPQWASLRRCQCLGYERHLRTNHPRYPSLVLRTELAAVEWPVMDVVLGSRKQRISSCFKPVPPGQLLEPGV